MFDAFAKNHASAMGAAAVAAVLALQPMQSIRAQDSDIDWWTIDGGGEIDAQGGDWRLSGSIGQWDASENGEATGGRWELTGGFWAGNSQSDFLFKDGYES